MTNTFDFGKFFIVLTILLIFLFAAYYLSQSNILSNSSKVICTVNYERSSGIGAYQISSANCFRDGFCSLGESNTKEGDTFVGLFQLGGQVTVDIAGSTGYVRFEPGYVTTGPKTSEIKVCGAPNVNTANIKVYVNGIRDDLEVIQIGG